MYTRTTGKKYFVFMITALCSATLTWIAISSIGNEMYHKGYEAGTKEVYIYIKKTSSECGGDSKLRVWKDITPEGKNRYSVRCEDYLPTSDNIDIVQEKNVCAGHSFEECAKLCGDKGCDVSNNKILK